MKQATPKPGLPDQHAPSVHPLDPGAFRKALMTWYRQNARTLPWRGISNPYATWLSEIMLQQTRVATVMERYKEFLHRFPTVQALAEAPEDDVLALWSGLGYYRRARMLHRGAQFVQRELAGVIPRTVPELRTLPGVGEYTAAAIASIAFGVSVAVLDGNVERVLLRLLGEPETAGAAARATLQQTASSLVPASPARRGQSNPPGDHNQAMMELGATICLPKGPLCLQCPVLAFCHTRGEHPTPTRRQLQSQRIACLLVTRKRGTRTEILLERRPAQASLMPGMLELPPLPLAAAEGREPVLRVRHSITNTSYYVEVFAEPAAAPAPTPDDEELESAAAQSDTFSATDEPGTGQTPEQSRSLPGTQQEFDALNEDDLVFAAEPGELGRSFGLRAQIPAAETDLLWISNHRLGNVPLTGLARKVLQRLGLMSTSPVRIGPGRSV